ncbi:MAG: hypothetical protein EOR33_16510 [Mesorhizobium sp.]|uniref:hypothetical protein n=1 Tax=Mesorhizobium sp. TaxID=1871066 RepID=UPI000FE2D202|nr:hypothetical protein [Mesorhizobium sp.]RWF93542.1 MAG: hypothetical protein EOQ45_16145 [Mesorhizobium sp.]RWJ67325.1 MAG: hypothetical protein EOR33_16510 [Mesorhizobium sp.]RWJ76734.1 MAG: hypothetical protein EOR34_01510 [Mesorhizobium sp.]
MTRRIGIDFPGDHAQNQNAAASLARMEAGMGYYLPKPISSRALLESVERWLGADGEIQRNAGSGIRLRL